MSDQKEIIHIRIRDLRRGKALTQEELASALGLSRQSINAMEAGRCLPSLPVALQIASFFAVPITAVFGEPLLEIEEEQPSRTSNLVPWSPLREMREALNDLIDESTEWKKSSETGVPAVNISQNNTFITVHVSVPGYTKDQVSIDVAEDSISITGESESQHVNSIYLLQEFSHQSFSRVISLPDLVEVDTADAEMKYGILTITLTKIREEKPKTARLQIKSHE